jgi:hypothetical protein
MLRSTNLWTSLLTSISVLSLSCRLLAIDDPSVPSSKPLVDAKKPPASIPDRVIVAAEAYLGQEWVFGGRDGRLGCLENGKKARCPKGVDCLSLIFFAYEKVLSKPWQQFSVVPSVLIRRQELGQPVLGLDGILKDELDPGKLKKADVLFFLIKGANLEADKPLLVRGEDKYGVWHTGLVHHVSGDEVLVIHAKPGGQVVMEPLTAIELDGLFVVRLPEKPR